MKTFGVAIIGYGGFGNFLHNSWSKLPNVKIVAVADEIESRDPGGDIKFYKDWRGLLKDEDVDIVSIATPPSSHSKLACALMDAGKHVLIEKPIATTMDDADEIVKCQERNGVVGGVNYMLRFNPIVEAMGLICRENLFGKLRHVDVENYAQDEGLPAEHWFWNSEIAGGILIEHAVHFIDLTHSLADQKIVAVNGLCHKRNERQEDQVLASVCYDEGLIATHYHSFARPGFFEDTSIRLNFDLAQVTIHGWIPLCGYLESIVSEEARKRLELILPNFEIHDLQKTTEVEDQSRPKGWGETVSNESRKKVRSGGIEYQVDEMIKAKFQLKEDKQEIYSDCVRAMLSDLIEKIKEPDHNQRVSLYDGHKSLEVAYRATQCGRKECKA